MPVAIAGVVTYLARYLRGGPLKNGRLSGKYSAANPPPGKRNFSAYPMAEIEPVLAVLRQIGGRVGKTPAQVSLNWLIAKGAIPIPGAKSASQARQNAEALGWQFSDDEMARLDRLSWR